MKNGYSSLNYYGRSLTIGAIIVIVLFTLLSVSGGGSVGAADTITYQIDRGVLGIAGAGNAEFITLSEVVSVELEKGLDIGYSLTGEVKGRIHTGEHHNDLFGDYLLYGYDNVELFVVINLIETVVVFNLDSVGSTEAAYLALLESVAN